VERQRYRPLFNDLTEREKQEKVVRGSLKEKEMLLKEIHHRIKNNLAVISGLLELQAMNAENESTLSTLRDSQLRIQSIAMVHEKLYQSEDFTDIGFDAYLKELVQTISQTYSSKDKQIDITYDLEPISLDLDQAIPCSLIVNEIVVNCYKHAFNEMTEGEIKITSEFEDPELTINITDNGTGIPEDFDITEYQSLGMTLVQTLTDQLEGDIDIFPASGRERGTVFELRFARD
jgi:two-component sensor histidine kinase